MRAPHTICPSCGFYNGELILPKKEKRKKGDQPNPEAGKGKE
jgi:hypothetical protein